MPAYLNPLPLPYLLQEVTSFTLIQITFTLTPEQRKEIKNHQQILYKEKTTQPILSVSSFLFYLDLDLDEDELLDDDDDEDDDRDLLLLLLLFLWRPRRREPLEDRELELEELQERLQMFSFSLGSRR